MTTGFTQRAPLVFVAILAVLASQWVGAAAPSLELEIELDPATRRFQAVALLQPESRDFSFELHESLQVNTASADGKALPFIAAGHDGALRRWQVKLPSNGGTLRLAYGGTLPALQRELDHRGVLGTLPPMADQAGSFLPAGAAWYPRPAPLFTYRATVSVPADQRAVVPGWLRSEEVPGGASGRYRADFMFSHPADGIDFMAGPWVIREKMLPRTSGAPLRLRTYFTHELDAIPGLADGYLEDAGHYLKHYGAQIGAYPYTAFSVVASPLPTGFGMPTLTYLGAEVLKLPFIRATSLGHEVLHNWWGNGVYVDYAHGNWSEGLTTFMADYAYKEDESPQAARAMRLGWLRDFAAAPAGAHQSLASFRARTHGAAAAVGYGKSAMLFVMLRDAIGEAAFRRGIRVFWDKHRFHTASWHDLQAAFEQASNRPLQRFFNQWLDRAEGPAVRIVHAAAEPHDDKIRLSVDVQQTEPGYALHLPLEIVRRGRTQTRWIDTAGAHDVVTVDLNDVPTGVRLDPDLRVWRMLDREQLPPILRQWIVARAPRLAYASTQPGVRAAAESLAQRLFENAPRTIAVDELKQGGEPILLAGLHAEVDAVLSRTGLPPRPEKLTGRGNAQVWTLTANGGAPIAVVSAQDADALRALLRALPHYGSQSWLVFDGARAIERGVWPAPVRLIPVQRAR